MYHPFDEVEVDDEVVEVVEQSSDVELMVESGAATLDGRNLTGKSEEEMFQELLQEQEKLRFQQLEAIPDGVRHFILQLYRCVNERQAAELLTLYEQSWPKLSEHYYAKSTWPEPELVSPLLHHHRVAQTLYRELWFRHCYGLGQPTLEQRFQSYDNYCDLFDYILGADKPVELPLPNQWLWDILDEFVYQYQSFTHFRDRLVKDYLELNELEQQKAQSNASNAGIAGGVDEESAANLDELAHYYAVLKEHNHIWSTFTVLNVLHTLVSKSNMLEQLRVIRAGDDVGEVAGAFGRISLYKMLGYFALVSLVRIHCLFGDYQMAVRWLQDVDLTKKAIFARVTSCHVATYYYVGFAYMMMNRTADAIRVLTNILVFMNRARQYQHRSHQSDQMNKMADKILALLTLCVNLTPTRLDDTLNSQMREKYGDAIQRMQRSLDDQEALNAYKELFLYACPKFVNPVNASFDNATSMIVAPSDRLQRQFNVWLDLVVKKYYRLSYIRSFLKLYTAVGVARMAAYLEIPEEEIYTQLLLFKQTAYQLKWIEGKPLCEGEQVCIGDLDFAMKLDTVQIAESKMSRRYGDWFLRYAGKVKDITNGLQNKVISTL